LQTSRDEYDKKAAAWISECAAPEYLTYADEAFTHEEKYCATLLQPETKPKLMKRVEKELISNRNQLIVEKPTGCKYMIENGRKDELKLLYKCFVREEQNLGRIIHCLNDYIETHGRSIVEDQTLQ